MEQRLHDSVDVFSKHMCHRIHQHALGFGPAGEGTQAIPINQGYNTHISIQDIIQNYLPFDYPDTVIIPQRSVVVNSEQSLIISFGPIALQNDTSRRSVIELFKVKAERAPYKVKRPQQPCR
jgi:hypothetical protein